MLAKAEIQIAASANKVWKALTDPEIIKQYMFGTTMSSDWKVGSPVTWKGEWKGKPYEDKGTILQFVPNRKLQYTHFSPMTGLEDKPENYHTVTIELQDDGNRTDVTLTQDKNLTEEERQHSEDNWKMMLEGLKKVVEGRS
jgi:uncharacterized protein YndB with AHSA1/START domain